MAKETNNLVLEFDNLFDGGFGKYHIGVFENKIYTVEKNTGEVNSFKEFESSSVQVSNIRIDDMVRPRECFLEVESNSIKHIVDFNGEIIDSNIERYFDPSKYVIGVDDLHVIGYIKVNGEVYMYSPLLKRRWELSLQKNYITKDFSLWDRCINSNTIMRDVVYEYETKGDSESYQDAIEMSYATANELSYITESLDEVISLCMPGHNLVVNPYKRSIYFSLISKYENKSIFKSNEVIDLFDIFFIDFSSEFENLRGDAYIRIIGIDTINTNIHNKYLDLNLLEDEVVSCKEAIIKNGSYTTRDISKEEFISLYKARRSSEEAYLVDFIELKMNEA